MLFPKSRDVNPDLSSCYLEGIASPLHRRWGLALGVECHSAPQTLAHPHPRAPGKCTSDGRYKNRLARSRHRAREREAASPNPTHSVPASVPAHRATNSEPACEKGCEAASSFAWASIVRSTCLSASLSSPLSGSTQEAVLALLGPASARSSGSGVCSGA